MILSKEEFEIWKKTRRMDCKFMRDSKKVAMAEAVEVLSEALEKIQKCTEDIHGIEIRETGALIAEKALAKVWGSDSQRNIMKDNETR